VYGPYGRPDMALFLFTDGIINQTPIKLFNYGNMIRDFTYVQDIVNGVELVIKDIVKTGGHEIYNIGYGEQVNLMDFVKHIERCTGKEAIMNLLPSHPADVPATWSDTTKLRKLGYNPTTSIATGVEKFVEWYKEYYNV
jgi:UDP-glucuronate 4-epimerase